ncbi:MAG: hypothetical protein ACPGXK_17265, partial [Phycisphaerae bacterium]
MDVENESIKPVASQQRTAAVVYLLLMTMALAVFVPSVLLPEWRKLQRVDAMAQVEQHKLNRIHAEIARLEEQLRAIKKDPAVMTRLAMRELNMMPSGTKAVRVDDPRGTASSFNTRVLARSSCSHAMLPSSPAAMLRCPS